MKQALLFMLMAFYCTTNCQTEFEHDTDIFDSIHIRNIENNHLHVHVPKKYEDCFPPEPTELPVRRIHSRHRRFIAPGAIWQIRVGVILNSVDSELVYNVNINYPMDYLFGGSVALIARLAANTASKNASTVVFQDTKAKLNAAIAAGIPLSSLTGRRKKRSGGGGNVLLQTLGRRKRDLGLKDEDADEDPEANINNILTRTVADDQLEILKKIEASLDKGGLPGRQCVLRTICEIKETPIHEWSLVGEMITNFILPKKDNLTALEEYRKAETIGEEHGDCWSFYPNCPFSIFNIIPDIYTKEDQVKVTFDDFSAGSETSKDGPDSQSDDGSTANRNATDADSDAYENDDALKILLKQFGGTSEDVKEVKVDLDLTKP